MFRYIPAYLPPTSARPIRSCWLLAEDTSAGTSVWPRLHVFGLHPQAAWQQARVIQDKSVPCGPEDIYYHGIYPPKRLQNVIPHLPGEGLYRFCKSLSFFRPPLLCWVARTKNYCIPKKLTEQGSKLSFDCLIATLFSAQWLPREALQLLVCVLLQLVVFWSAPSKIWPSASQSR